MNEVFSIGVGEGLVVKVEEEYSWQGDERYEVYITYPYSDTKRYMGSIFRKSYGGELRYSVWDYINLDHLRHFIRAALEFEELKRSSP